MSERPEEHTAVLIVGGGVTGLSTALFLARQGVRPILVERHPDTAIMPKARAFNPRSMEIYRAFGLEAQVRERTSMLVDFPEMLGADTLTGSERFRFDLFAQVRPPKSISPTDWAMVDQDDLERILCADAEHSGVDIRFGTELRSFDTADDRVSAVLGETANGPEHVVRADYLVAADGHRAGIRKQLGVAAGQRGSLEHVLYLVFEADLNAALGGRRFALAYLGRPKGGTVLVPMRRFGTWLLGVPCDAPPAAPPGERECVELVRQAVGDPNLSVTLVAPVPGWQQKVVHGTGGAWVADRYRVGRVFFAGDAAHVVPPSGSYGANTGIADAHNLAWKLAAVLHRRAADALLDSYSDERRPVAEMTMETALRLLHERHGNTGAAETEVDDLSMIFGYRYSSPAVLDDEAAPGDLAEDPRTSTGRPGSRAPHIWLERAGERFSTVELCTGTFTLLVARDGTCWVEAARGLGASEQLRVEQVGVELGDPDGRFLDAYGITDTGATLIRPDGFVAWRAREHTCRADRDLRDALARILARPCGVGDGTRTPTEA